jgi:hypothetical protein
MKVSTLQRSSFAQALVFAIGLTVTAAVLTETSAAASAPTAAKVVKKSPGQPAAPKSGMVLESKATDFLKEVSAKLASAKSMSFTASVGYEYPSKLGPPIVYTMRYDVTMLRPDKLRVLMPGDGPASEFYYDGKTMMAYAPGEDLVAVTDAPPTIDATLKSAYDIAALYFPFTDLLAADPYAALTEGVILAFYIGPSGVVGGVKTDMVSWANNDVFLQIWIGADDKLPRRIRAVYSADPLRLRHDMELTNWQIDGVIAADAFASQQAQAAKRIVFAHPFQPPPPGIKPLGRGKPPKTGAVQPASKSQ